MYISQQEEKEQFLNSVRARYFDVDAIKGLITIQAERFSNKYPEETAEFREFICSEFNKLAQKTNEIKIILDKALDIKDYEELQQLVANFRKS